MQETQELSSSSNSNWYSQTYVKFEIVKQLQHKYMSYAFFNEKTQRYSLSRYYFGYSLEKLNSAFQKIGDLYNKKFYSDLAYWNYMPIFSWNISKVDNGSNERKENKKEWDTTKQLHFIGFDFALDFDSVNWKISYKECKKVVNYFDSFNIPYSLKWSGAKGFHITIKDKYFAWKPNTKVKRFMEIAKFLKAKFKLKTLDLQIYDMNRILKLAYTIDCKSGLIALPLNDTQFNNFNPAMCHPENVIKSIMIKNRGVCEREGTTDNVKKMMKEIF